MSTADSTVVAGYTPGPLGRRILSAAIAQARRRNASLLVVNVSMGESWVDSRLADDDDWQAVRDELRESGIPHRMSQIDSRGTPAEEVLRAAQEEGADLIVIGLRHRTPVGKMILGSAAQQILLDAHCPVLAVKE